MAAQQLPVDFDSPPVVPLPLTQVPTLTDSQASDRFTVTGDGFSLAVSRTTGEIISFDAMGMRLVNAGPVPNFWRAPTDNDRGNGHPTRNGTWRAAGRNRTVTGVVLERPSDRSRRITVTGTLPTSTQSTFPTTYTVYGNGEIRVDGFLHPGASSLPYIPEVGTILMLPAALEQMHYYGRGPEENHWDRHTGTDVGRYSSTVVGPVDRLPPSRRRTATRPMSAGSPWSTAPGAACSRPASRCWRSTPPTSPRRTCPPASGTTTS